jgi:hypothetical protein
MGSVRFWGAERTSAKRPGLAWTRFGRAMRCVTGSTVTAAEPRSEASAQAAERESASCRLSSLDYVVHE